MNEPAAHTQDRDRLERIRDGAGINLAVTAAIVLLFTLAAAMILAVGEDTFDRKGEAAEFAGFVAIGFFAATVALIALKVYGVIAFTTPHAHRPRAFTAAKVMRICTSLMIIIPLTALALIIAALASAPPPGEPAASGGAFALFIGGLLIWITLPAVTFVLGIISYSACMRHIRTLGLEIGDDGLARWGATLAWLGPVLLIIGAPLLIGPPAAAAAWVAMLIAVRRAIRRRLDTAPAAPAALAPAPA